MGDLSMLSLNTATAKYASLAECASACAEAGLGWIGPWRNRIQEVGSADAAKIISAVGLSVSTVCRGGFITATEPDSRSRAIVENTRAIEEAEALGARELVMVVGGLPAGDKNLVSGRPTLGRSGSYRSQPWCASGTGANAPPVHRRPWRPHHHRTIPGHSRTVRTRGGWRRYRHIPHLVGSRCT